MRLHGDWSNGGHLEMEVTGEDDAARWRDRLAAAMDPVLATTVVWSLKNERNGDTSVEVPR